MLKQRIADVASSPREPGYSVARPADAVSLLGEIIGLPVSMSARAPGSRKEETMVNAFQIGLDRNRANYAALTPLSFLFRSVDVLRWWSASCADSAPSDGGVKDAIFSDLTPVYRISIRSPLTLEYRSGDVAFQMAEVAILKNLFAEIQRKIA